MFAKVLAGICAVLMLGFELAASYLVKHRSETYARVTQQYARAVRIRPSGLGEPTSVLMVGNSLLMEGIKLDDLEISTADRMRIYPIFLEATGYYDWLFGLQRLFHEGARPDVVVLGVGVQSFLSNSVREEYAPLMLFDTRDVLQLAAELGMDRTATSNLLLGHSSQFWDVRSVVRTQILRRIVPGARELFSLIKAKPTIPPDSEFETMAISRLQTLRELCEAHGAKLIFLIPPTPSSEKEVNLLEYASKRVGVVSSVPIDPASLPESYYQSDAIHLNSKGAALLTSALAASLPAQIGASKAAISQETGPRQSLLVRSQSFR
jgi:hypothetical protein